MNILLPIETINREIDFKLVISSYLSGKGHDVYIGQHDFLIKLLPLYKFGVKLLGVSFISRFYVQSLNLICAKSYSPVVLGLYTKATSLQNVPIDIINSPFFKGIYPTLVRLQEDINQLKKIVLNNIKVVTFLILEVSRPHL